MKSNFGARVLAWLSHIARDMPIRQKLMLIVMVTTVFALVVAGVGIVLADFFLFRSYLKNDLSALAQMISDNTTASLAFDDPATAADTLGSLRERTHVATACVFRQSGALFAKYTRANATVTCAAPEPQNEIRFQNGALLVSRPILLDKQRLGTLVLVYDLGESRERIQLYGATVFGVLLFATAIALLLSGRLRSLITDPIVELAGVTTKVSRSRDYRIRAKKLSGDELGLLVDTFNEMLSSIQSRDLELRESNENLARSNEDLERFAFIASHDLQEPLRMISIYLQLLGRKYNQSFDEQAAKYMQNIEGGAKRMRDLLADLLAYAEIGGRMEIPVEPVDLNSVVQKAKDNLALAVIESKAAISAAQLPVIRGLESHFVPLFQNLVGNAIKYRGDRQPKIDISASRSNGQLQICVADNGIGIASEYYSKIFIAFKRLHGNKIPGTGIGLAICQRIVEKYGGRIWVESNVGKGSKFFFTLPANLVTKAEIEEP